MTLQAAKHGKTPEVAAEVKAQLKEKIETKQDPLAEVILEAGKAKLAKKPHNKQTELTSVLQFHAIKECFQIFQSCTTAYCASWTLLCMHMLIAHCRLLGCFLHPAFTAYHHIGKAWQFSASFTDCHASGCFRSGFFPVHVPTITVHAYLHCCKAAWWIDSVSHLVIVFK